MTLRGTKGGAFLKFMWAMSIVALLIGVGGGLVLTLRAQQPPVSPELSFSPGTGPGVLLLEPASVAGADPFTAPVAVDLGLDPSLIALPPLSPDTLLTPHRRGSIADRLAAGEFGFDLVRRRDSGQSLTVGLLRTIAGGLLGLNGVLEDLEDRNGDGRDDDRTFTLRASDGSAVCITLGFERTLTVAQGIHIDPEDGAAAHGYSWDPLGPCSDPVSLIPSSAVLTGSTPGVYGGSPAGEVCDLGELIAGLTGSPQAGEGWATVQGIEVDELEDFISALTPVVLMRDTVTTDFGWRSGELLPRQAVLQMGTAVLITEKGALAARCISGSPLRPPQPVPAAPTFEGTPWAGFVADDIMEILPSDHSVAEFTLVDVATGGPVGRKPGSEDARASLAGPLIPASG